MPLSSNPIKSGDAAKYRIEVIGDISETSRRNFAGMKIEKVSGESVQMSTVLVGEVLDQAELRGILEALYGLDLPIISVELIKNNENKRS